MASVVVVGGGMTGVSVAHALARRGVSDVRVLEEGYLGGGSTFKCAGGIRASFSSEEHVVLMTMSIDLWARLSEELGFYYERGGYVWLLSSEDQVTRFRELSRFHNSLGLPTRLVDAEELKELVPSIDGQRALAALFDPMAGKASPFEALHALYLDAKRMGVVFAQGVRASKIVSKGGTVLGVETNRGFIRAESVVVAAGFGTRGLLKTVGFDAPLENVPHHALITEPYEEAFKPLVVDVATGAYIVQAKHGNFLMGVEVEEQAGFRPLVRADFAPKVLRVWSRWFSWLPNAVVLRYWVGYYVMTPDHHPILGPVPGVEGLYVAAGFSGHGFMMAPVVGEELASWILSGSPESEHAARLTPSRFAEGRIIHERVVIG